MINYKIGEYFDSDPLLGEKYINMSRVTDDNVIIAHKQ